MFQRRLCVDWTGVCRAAGGVMGRVRAVAPTLREKGGGAVGLREGQADGGLLPLTTKATGIRKFLNVVGSHHEVRCRSLKKV